MPDFKPLKLYAQSGEDVAALSAPLQDAICQIGDLQYQKRAKQFTLAVNRYCWELDEPGHGWRVRSGLQIGGVQRVQTQNLRLGAQEGVLNLLSVQFEPLDAPAGVILLTFSGGGGLRLSVECPDLILADISEPWRALARPDHEIDANDER